MPKVYVIPDASPNAFATGRNPQHAAVAATEGIMQALAPHELEGVIAHELAHVKHRDILISSVAATIAAAIMMAARMAMYAGMFAGGRDDRDGQSNPIALLAMAIFAPMAAMLIQMAISRSREFAADAGAAAITHNPRRSPMRCGRSIRSRTVCRSTPTRPRRTCSSSSLSPGGGCSRFSARIRRPKLASRRCWAAGKQRTPPCGWRAIPTRHHDRFRNSRYTFPHSPYLPVYCWLGPVARVLAAWPVSC